MEWYDKTAIGISAVNLFTYNYADYIEQHNQIQEIFNPPDPSAYEQIAEDKRDFREIMDEMGVEFEDMAQIGDDVFETIKQREKSEEIAELPNAPPSYGDRPPPNENEQAKNIENSSEKTHGFSNRAYNVAPEQAHEQGAETNILGRAKITSLSGQDKTIDKSQEQTETPSEERNILGRPKITSLSGRDQTKELINER